MKIFCQFSNASFRIATPKARLRQKQTYYTHNKQNKNIVLKNLVSVTGQAVSAHTSGVRAEIMLTIPPSASLTISNCSILVVDYVIEVGANKLQDAVFDSVFDPV